MGDYTARLASELGRSGISCSMIALNDKFCKKDLPLDILSHVGPLLRLPEKSSWKSRIQIASQYINQFAPDWISLQYVPYAFHRKGLPLYLPAIFKKITRGRRSHIMFHELWLGENTTASISHRILGSIQKFIVTLLTSQKERKLSTSNDLYRSWLRTCGCTNTAVIPLFGNIPLPPHENMPAPSPNRNLKIGIFGATETRQLAIQQAEFVQKLSEKLKRKVAFQFIGHVGSATDSFYSRLFPDACKTGFLEQEKVIQALGDLDLFLSGTNVYRFNKSGSSALALELGLPVVVGDLGWIPRNLEKAQLGALPEGATLIRDHLLDDPDAILRRRSMCSRLPEVARVYEKLLAE